MPEDAEIRVCDSDALQEKGAGVRFEIQTERGTSPAFVVRYHGRAYAWLNRCAHVAIELDWQHGEFFDTAGLYLICSTHGATYEPDSGRCVAGPCKGARLQAVRVIERDGAIYLDTNHHD